MSDATAPARFVVLHHVDVARPHFDLMIESAPVGELMTWRCDKWPIEPEAHLTRQPDHRRAYLEYEGPISGGRGRVTRVAGGVCGVRWITPRELHLHLPGATLVLEQLEQDDWLARK